MIAVTQPHKVAATSLIARVAKEQQTTIHVHIGYSVCFNEVSLSNTCIKYVMDSMPMCELLGDPLLSCYSIVIINEVHKCTLRTGLLIANLRMIQHAHNSANTNSSTGRCSLLVSILTL